MPRILGAVRQSKTKDRAVSPRVQREAITSWALARDHEVAKITEDLSRSGGISPFHRPELGPWLTDEARLTLWDVLVVTKLDRACRSTRDYLELRQWCQERGKRFVSLANPELDETTPSGKAMGSLQAVFGELERDMASERTREARDAMLEAGRWPGGRMPYGWRADKQTDGYYLVPDETGTAPVLREMARHSIEGWSNGQIARELNDRGILTGRGYRWRPDTVRMVLRARPTTELLGEELSAQLRAALRNRQQHRGERVNGHMLLRVAYCGECKQPMYCQVRSNYRAGGYYRCLQCGIYKPKDRLESFVEMGLLETAGPRTLRRKVLVPGDDHAREIGALEAKLETLRDIPEVDSSPIETKLAELRAMPHEADRWDWQETGETVAEHWASLATDDQKGRFLRAWGVRLDVDRKRGNLKLGWLLEGADTFDLG